MSKSLIGAQMYTLRDYCKTPADIATSCAQVKAMGYDGIQASGMADIGATELRKVLDGITTFSEVLRVTMRDEN